MIKRYPLFLLLLIVIAAASCKKERKDMLVRIWQEVAIDNPQFDEVMKSQQHFIDTAGLHATAAENLSSYGTSNMDSFRRGMQESMDSFRKMQLQAIAKTQYDFRADGKVFVHTDAGVDSASWKLEEDGTTLVLDGQRIRNAQITELNDTSLKLKFSDNNASGTASFVPAKK